MLDKDFVESAISKHHSPFLWALISDDIDYDYDYVILSCSKGGVDFVVAAFHLTFISLKDVKHPNFSEEEVVSSNIKLRSKRSVQTLLIEPVRIFVVQIAQCQNVNTHSHMCTVCVSFEVTQVLHVEVTSRPLTVHTEVLCQLQ